MIQWPAVPAAIAQPESVIADKACRALAANGITNRPGDMVFEIQGVKCFVDPMSSMYLLGVEVDYVEGQFGQSGFSFKNPNAKHTCGCGSSFSA